MTPLERYINANTPILHRHKKCGHDTKMTPKRVLSGSGCVLCKGLKISQTSKKTHEQFIKELFKINSNIEISSSYNGHLQNIDCKCKICGHIWSTRAGHLLESHGCPSCNESIGERNIRIFLDSKNIKFITPYKFDDLMGMKGGFLSYDFYLPDFNLLIEFQGEQHEHQIDFFGGENQFKIQQEHDKRKRDYAKIHNINLLEIWYYDINNVKNIIERCLNNLKSETVTTTGVA